ncbi:MAG: MetQ/NlpA family ABC transporter substrate-binding protein [Firmicutes bacterium]|nr:MetQ/NlpA family ABC transporter substrate-binding protein [Bacillota bacterium]
MKKILSLAIAFLFIFCCFAGCSGNNDKKIVVAASVTPHADILKICKEELEKQGYTLEIREMTDYVTPNNATESGDVDANYFQHQPYLDSFNESNNTHLVSVAKIHYEPYAIYAGTVSSLSDLTEGSIVAVTNDPSNEARALQLLAAQGLIKLKDGVGLKAAKSDIIENPLNLDIREMEAALLPTVLDEVAIAVINGNYAIGAGLKVSEALAAESADSEAAQTFANILVVKEGNENLPKIKALVEALQSEAVRNYINETFDKAVVPIF